jgi:hypothetical protein
LIAGLLVAFIAAAAVAGQLLNRPPDELTGPPERGESCPFLSAAFKARLSGDEVAFRDSVSEAARVAKASLNRSGELFGTPEKLAVELSFALSGDQIPIAKSIDGRLDRAAESCSNLGRWPTD